MRRPIGQCLGMAWISVRDRLQYRLNFFMTFLATVTFGILYFMVWKAIYQYSKAQVLPWQTLLTYVMIGQAISFARFSPAERGPIYAMEQRIQTGDVALDLIRPVGFQLQRFAESLGFFIVDLLWVVLPSFLLFFFTLKLSPPKDGMALIAFIISLLIGFVVAFSLNSILMMINFWTVNAQGLHKAKKALVEILAGTLIPFDFFPAWLKAIATHLPFQSMAYIPLSIYIGRLHGAALWQAFGEQILWAIGMLALSRFLWKFASRQITIYGG